MIPILKNAVLQFSEVIGINARLHDLHREKLLVLCYHGVVPGDQKLDPFFYRIMVDCGEFDRQLGILRRLFTPVSVLELLDSLEGRAELPDRAALVTFDDGYLNNLTQAVPILERHGIPALFNVTTGYIGTRRMLWPLELGLRILRWHGPILPIPDGRPDRRLHRELPRRRLAEELLELCKRLPDEAREAYLDRLRDGPMDAADDSAQWSFLSWDDVRELKRRGFAIGSHTVEHPILTRVDGKRMKRELEESKAKLEKELGEPCASIAYPNGARGDFSLEVTRAARDAGYRLGFILTGGFNCRRPDAFEIDRVDIPGGQPIWVFQSRVSGLYSLFKKGR